MKIPAELRCLEHTEPLAPDAGAQVEDATFLVCSRGCRVPVVKNIPRFVSSDNYASGFGLQWNAFRKTQLDSYTGTTISRDRLTRCLGGSLDAVRGRSVLEVGCGAGRFTEILLDAGANVFACDLSSAVEANYANCGHAPNYFVCQANVKRLPAAPQSFDFVVCLGVIQHTPSPEETIQALAACVRPGGMLVIDHYAQNYPQNFFQRNLRRVLIRLPARIAKPLTMILARTLVAVHKLTWTRRRGMWRLRKYLVKYSPLIDYYDSYSQLDRGLIAEWSVLDTHDTLTDYYKHLRTSEEIEACLKSCGLVQLEISYGGNGVEARAKLPAAPAGCQAGAGA